MRKRLEGFVMKKSWTAYIEAIVLFSENSTVLSTPKKKKSLAPNDGEREREITKSGREEVYRREKWCILCKKKKEMKMKMKQKKTMD